MKIGILGAMIEEIQAIKSNMKEVKTREIGGREYYFGKLHGIDTTLAFSRWGKVASSSTVTTLINTFCVEMIIFTGVAGAVSQKLNRGDVVVSKGLYQHDMDARPLFKRHQIPLTEMILFRPEEFLVKHAQKAAENFVAQIEQRLSRKTLKTFSIVSPKVHVGIIASGDQFITNAAEHEALRMDGEEVLAVEMEGAAIAQVCHEHQIPYVVVRTISDKADHSATIDFPAFIKQIASHYSVGIVEGIYAGMAEEPLRWREKN